MAEETRTQLDVRGEICPFPMMKTVQALKGLKKHQTELEVVTDHAPALETIPTQAARLGYESAVDETEPSEWHILLTKKQ